MPAQVEYEKEAIYQRRSKLGANECHRNLQHAELEELQQQVFRLKQELKVTNTARMNEAISFTFLR